jgi:hypothetical protein
MTHLGEILGIIWVECFGHGGAWRETGVYMGIKKEIGRGRKKRRRFIIMSANQATVRGQVIVLTLAPSSSSQHAVDKHHQGRLDTSVATRDFHIVVKIKIGYDNVRKRKGGRLRYRGPPNVHTKKL